jgi:phospholipid/cholesterol/gamma-HCH transport system permease protein
VFLARVTSVPVILVALPLGATVALQVGQLAGQLVTPRLWAASVVSTLLASLVIVSGAVGGFLFNVMLQDVTPGAYFDGAVALLQTSDLVVTLFKAWLFGLTSAIVACYMGMNCAASPVGVGRAVNRSIVVSFMFVFPFNYLIITVYFVAYPPRT